MPATADDLIRLAESFDWSAWADELGTRFDPIYRSVVVEQGHVTAEAFGLAAFVADDPYLTQWMTQYVGERIVSVTDATRADVIKLIRAVFDRGGPGSTRELGTELVTRLRQTFDDEYPRWRADRIARTETAIAYNHGTAMSCHQSGVAEVVVSDGDCDICKEVDGQVWPVARALDEPVAHPNCERAFTPHIEGAGKKRRGSSRRAAARRYLAT